MVTSLPQYSLILLTNTLTHHFLVDISKLSYSYPTSGIHPYNPTLSLIPGDTSLLHDIIVGLLCFSTMLWLCHKITQAHPNWNANLKGRGVEAGRHIYWYIPKPTHCPELLPCNSVCWTSCPGMSNSGMYTHYTKSWSLFPGPSRPLFLPLLMAPPAIQPLLTQTLEAVIFALFIFLTFGSDWQPSPDMPSHGVCREPPCGFLDLTLSLCFSPNCTSLLTVSLLQPFPSTTLSGSQN